MHTHLYSSMHPKAASPALWKTLRRLNYAGTESTRPTYTYQPRILALVENGVTKRRVS